MSTVVSLPPVTGRHRNHALAAARRTSAVQLRTQGWTYEAIAQQLGYSNRGTAFAIVRKALDRHEAEEVDRFRSLETARLDRLQASLWGRAMAGDVAAAAQARRIIETRIRLLGLLLDRVPQHDESCRTVVCTCPSCRTVVCTCPAWERASSAITLASPRMTPPLHAMRCPLAEDVRTAAGR
jgi:hypothetical protein